MANKSFSQVEAIVKSLELNSFDKAVKWAMEQTGESRDQLRNDYCRITIGKHSKMVLWYLYITGGDNE